MFAKYFSILLIFCSLCSTAGISLHAVAPSLKPSKLEALDLTDFRGRNWTLKDFEDDSILVVAFFGTECPLAQFYATRLNRIAQQYSDESVQVIAVMSNRQDSLEEIATFASRRKLSYPVAKDPANRFANQIGAERTPEVFVYDSGRILRYRGRIDDQRGVAHDLLAPRRRDLQLAIDELIEGTKVSVPRTEASGCIISRTKQVDSESTITYGTHIAKILRKNCVGCHREDELAPFRLTNGEEASCWADMIAEVIREDRMPPWHADDKHEKFVNERRLTEEEKQLIFKWAEAGAPIGPDPKLPPLPAKPVGWQLPKEPDLVLPVTFTPVLVPAETGSRGVRYQWYMQAPGFTEDKWVTAAELRPGNKDVVHHILAFAVKPGEERSVLRRADVSYLFGYVPGARVEPLPRGHAKKIPAGYNIYFQVHYTPNGTPQKVQSQMGLVFADPKDVTHEIQTSSATERRFNIPGGRSLGKDEGPSNFPIEATSNSLPANATLLAFSPHMHLRGKSFSYDLRSPGKKSRVLLNVPDYDFNWQTTYVLDKPLELAAGSTLHCKAVYDNSLSNLSNPDPMRDVRFGEQTWDEMMIGFFHYSVPVNPTKDSDSD
ncbi:redoxin domain-containing protein [Rubripirellula sp.]|nr:redoxin domain-containing protein [Rubripirellula sp.]MDB4749591.1 redoxin domain-containing protein [Rubripirellula sp.]